MLKSSVVNTFGGNIYFAGDDTYCIYFWRNILLR